LEILTEVLGLFCEDEDAGDRETSDGKSARKDMATTRKGRRVLAQLDLGQEFDWT
jgi:hypothetical protein